MIFGRKKLDGTDLLAVNSRSVQRVQSNDLVADLTVGIDYDYTHAGTGAGTEFEDASHRVARQIQVRGSFGSESLTFLSAVPRDLLTFSKLLDPTTVPQTQPDTAAGAGVTESDMRTDISLRFDGQGMVDPSVLGLPLGAVSGVEIITDGGAAGDLVYGESGADPSITINGTDLTERRFLKRRAVPSPLFTAYTSYTISASEDGKRLYLPDLPRGAEVARVMIAAEVDDTKNGLLVDDAGLVLDGSQVFEKLPAGQYQRQNVSDYNLSAVETGVILFDFAQDGMADLFAIRTQDRPYVDADVALQAGTNKIRIVTQYVRRQR